MPARTPRLGSGWILPVTAVVVAALLSLIASYREGISGRLYGEIALWTAILGGLGISVVVAGAHFIDRHDPAEPPAEEPRGDH